MEKEPVRIVNLSGGKDSTAMLLWFLERKEPFDAVVFMDTGWEFPEMYAHMAQLKAAIDVPVVRVTHTSSFDYMLTEYTLTKGQRRGLKGYGFCTPKSRWCTRLKTNAIKQWCSAHYPHRPICHYIGIAADETARQKKRTMDNVTNRYPLVEWGKTEADCLTFCKDRGFTWGGCMKNANGSHAGAARCKAKMTCTSYGQAILNCGNVSNGCSPAPCATSVPTTPLKDWNTSSKPA